MYIDAALVVLTSELIKDDDGATVDAIVYETRDGGFGELEFNRLDTRPLLMKTKLREC